MELCRLSNNFDVNFSAKHSNIECRELVRDGSLLIISNFYRYGKGYDRRSDFHVRIFPDDIKIMIQELAKSNHYEARKYIKAVEIFDSISSFKDEHFP